MLLRLSCVRSSCVIASQMISEAAICLRVPRSADFINPFSQYQNSQCEKAVMNLTGFFFLCETIRAQLADRRDKDANRCWKRSSFHCWVWAAGSLQTCQQQNSDPPDKWAASWKAFSPDLMRGGRAAASCMPSGVITCIRCCAQTFFLRLLSPSEWFTSLGLFTLIRISPSPPVMTTFIICYGGARVFACMRKARDWHL